MRIYCESSYNNTDNAEIFKIYAKKIKATVEYKPKIIPIRTYNMYEYGALMAFSLKL